MKTEITTMENKKLSKFDTLKIISLSNSAKLEILKLSAFYQYCLSHYPAVVEEYKNYDDGGV